MLSRGKYLWGQAPATRGPVSLSLPSVSQLLPAFHLSPDCCGELTLPGRSPSSAPSTPWLPALSKLGSFSKRLLC